MLCNEDGLAILDPPGLSWQGRYTIAMSRYGLTFWVVPHLSRYLNRVLYIAVIVEDVLRHVYRDFEIGKHMDYDGCFERYARRVEASVDVGDSEDLERVWREHAERLLTKYGNPTEQWMRDRPGA